MVRDQSIAQGLALDVDGLSHTELVIDPTTGGFIGGREIIRDETTGLPTGTTVAFPAVVGEAGQQHASVTR